MHSDSSEDTHEQPTPENASQQPARGTRKEDQNRSRRGVNQKSLLSDESSGVGHLCNWTTTEGPATALPILPVKVSAQGNPFASRPTPSWIRVPIPLSALTCFWIVLALKASI